MEKFEKVIQPESTSIISEALSTMNGIFGQIQQLGRNDSEIPSAQALLHKVEAGELSPEAGVTLMQALLDSKQLH